MNWPLGCDPGGQLAFTGKKKITISAISKKSSMRKKVFPIKLHPPSNISLGQVNHPLSEMGCTASRGSARPFRAAIRAGGVLIINIPAGPVNCAGTGKNAKSSRFPCKWGRDLVKY